MAHQESTAVSRSSPSSIRSVELVSPLALFLSSLLALCSSPSSFCIVRHYPSHRREFADAPWEGVVTALKTLHYRVRTAVMKSWSGGLPVGGCMKRQCALVSLAAHAVLTASSIISNAQSFGLLLDRLLPPPSSKLGLSPLQILMVSSVGRYVTIFIIKSNMSTLMPSGHYEVLPCRSESSFSPSISSLRVASHPVPLP